MAKQRSFDEILADFEKVSAELEAAKGARVAELAEQAKALGYKLVPIGDSPKSSKATTKGVDRDSAREWLENELKDGPKEKKSLQEAYRGQFNGSRLRVDGWKDLLKEDSKGNVTLK